MPGGGNGYAKPAELARAGSGQGVLSEIGWAREIGAAYRTRALAQEG